MNQTSDGKVPSESILRKIGRGLKRYLTDWRNLLGHALLGVVFLVIAIWAPLNIWIKLAIIICLIAFNVLRMRRKARRAAQKAEAEEKIEVQVETAAKVEETAE